MTEAKHTPGPWKQHPDYPWIIKEDNAPISEDGVSICNTTSHPDSGFFPTPSESRANARLIAAAPELLEALQESVQLFELQSQMHRLVSRRAKGMQGIAVDDDGLAIEWQSLRALADCMIERRNEAIAKATGKKNDG